MYVFPVFAVSQASLHVCFAQLSFGLPTRFAAGYSGLSLLSVVFVIGSSSGSRIMCPRRATALFLMVWEKGVEPCEFTYYVRCCLLLPIPIGWWPYGHDVNEVCPIYGVNLVVWKHLAFCSLRLPFVKIRARTIFLLLQLR